MDLNRNTTSPVMSKKTILKVRASPSNFPHFFSKSIFEWNSLFRAIHMIGIASNVIRLVSWFAARHVHVGIILDVCNCSRCLIMIGCVLNVKYVEHRTRHAPTTRTAYFRSDCLHWIEGITHPMNTIWCSDIPYSRWDLVFKWVCSSVPRWHERDIFVP